MNQIKHLLLLSFALVFVAATASAAPSYFPRSSLGYAKLTGGYELTSFMDFANYPEEVREDGKVLKLIENRLMVGLQHVEVCMMNVRIEDEVPVVLAFVARYDQIKDTEWMRSLDDDIEDGSFEKAFRIGTYRNTTTYAAKDSDAFIFIGLAGREVILSTTKSGLHQVIDAIKGELPAEESLATNPRFLDWQATTPASTLQMFADLRECKRLFDRVAEGESDEELKAITAFLEYMSLDSADYFSASANVGEKARGQIRLVTRNPMLPLNAVPPAGRLSMLQYLPENTGFFVAGHWGNLNRSFTNAMAEIKDAVEFVDSKIERRRKSKRDIFDERLHEAEDYFRDFVGPIMFGWRIAAAELSKKSSEPFTGSAEELVKLLERPDLKMPLFGFTLREVRDLAYDPTNDEISGAVVYKDALGMGIRLNLGSESMDSMRNMGEMWGEGVPNPIPEARKLASFDLIDGGVNVMLFLAGLDRTQASKLIGTNGVVGMAPDEMSLMMMRQSYTDFGEEDGIFAAVELRDRATLLSRFKTGLQVVPQAKEFLMREDADGNTHINFTYQEPGFDAIAVGPFDFGFAITTNALLIGRPGNLEKLVSNRRPPNLTAFGATPNAVGNAMIGYDARALRGEYYERLPLLRADYYQALDTSIVVTLDVKPTTVSIDMRGHFKSSAELLSSMFSRRAGYRAREREYKSVAAYHTIARGLYELRLADDDAENDSFPTLVEAMAHKTAEIEDKQWGKEGGKIRKVPADVHSETFGISLQEAWILLPSALEIEIGEGYAPIAISQRKQDSRYLVLVRGGSFVKEYLTSESFAKQLIAAAESPGSAKQKDFHLYNLVQLSNREAGLFLRSYWLDRGERRVRERAEELNAQAGDAFHVAGFGYVHIVSAQEGYFELKIEGFGHWMEVDSDFGVVGASWLKSDDE